MKPLRLAGLAVLLGGAVFAAALGAAQVGDGAPRTVPGAGNRIALSAQDSRRAAEAGLLPDGVRSVLKVEGRLRHGQFVWDERGAPQGELFVRVDLRSQLLSVFRGGHEIGTAVILYGADSHETPAGTFPIIARLRDHRSSTYDNAPMPYTLRLTPDGVAIHGSTVRDGRATHGCIGVPLEFAKSLFEAARQGDRVQIVAA